MKHRSPIARVAGFAAAAVCSLAVAPAAASADPAVVFSQIQPAQLVPSARVPAITVTADGDFSTAHRISVAWESPGTWVVWDSAGVTAPVTADETCEQVDANTARCRLPGGAERGELLVEGGARDDIVNLRRSLRLVSYVEPVSGDDRILGSESRDVVFAAGGDDVLIGFGGPDVLFGAGGDDTIRARDGRVDQISCGKGRARREKAIRDGRDKPIALFEGEPFERIEPISC